MMSEPTGPQAFGDESVDNSGETGQTGAADGPTLEESRLARLHQLAETPRRTELRRLAAANRILIDRLVNTTASVEQLADMADRLEEISQMISDLPSGGGYEGFREAANAGNALKGQQSAAQTLLDSGLTDVDPERYAFFDHSPFIGLANPISPPIDVRYSEDTVVAHCVFGAAYEGPPGCVHGGYVAAMFDELLGATQSLSGMQGMTARLIVNYRSPTPLATELRMEGRLVSVEGRKITTEAQLYVGDRLCAEGEALFVSFDVGRFRELLAERPDRLGS